MNCTASCKTKDHADYGDCLRANMPMFDGSASPTRSNTSLEFLHKDEKELSSYFDATRQGIEPISTKKKDIDAAVRLSNETGVAFDGNKI
jgi:hypothetical protein